MRSRRLLPIGSLLTLAACATAAPSAQSAPTAAAASWAVPALPAPAPISREEFQARRAAAAARMEDGLLLVLGEPEPERDYLPFAQRPDFRYLTGIEEPGAALLMEKLGGEVTERLFVLPRNPAREVWEGVRLGAEGAARQTGIGTRTIGELPAVLDSLLSRTPRLYVLSEARDADALLAPLSAEQQLVQRLAQRNPRLQVISLPGLTHGPRAVKSAAEIDRLRRAIYITVLAHRAAMSAVEPGMNEFEIHALIEYTFRRNGAERPAFGSIVGSGPNSTTLHYGAADRFMRAGETLVLDIGASYDGYAADVTRTLPVNGRFSPEQRAVYEVVLAAQKAAEARARVGVGWAPLVAAAESALAEGLARLGLIDAPDATYQCTTRAGDLCPQFRLFYMHGLGHGIGLEVHDLPAWGGPGTFAAGTTFTIEPGIYIRADALDHLPDTPGNRAMVERLRPSLRRYQNIGVRIEDDYLVTQSGVERLSVGAPREISEVEALMALPAGTGTERHGEVVEWYRSLKAR